MGVKISERKSFREMQLCNHAACEKYVSQSDQAFDLSGRSSSRRAITVTTWSGGSGGANHCGWWLSFGMGSGTVGRAVILGFPIVRPAFPGKKPSEVPPLLVIASPSGDQSVPDLRLLVGDIVSRWCSRARSGSLLWNSLYEDVDDSTQ